jgi:hypothetical protein
MFHQVPGGSWTTPVVSEPFGRSRPFATRAKSLDAIAQFHSLNECIDAPGLRKQIEWIGLEQDQLSDLRPPPRCSLHGNRPAERVANEINLIGIYRQCRFDKACLIVK